MKHLPAILFIAAAVLCGSVSAPAQAAPILDFAVRVGCDFQQPEMGLMDLHVLQGSTPPDTAILVGTDIHIEGEKLGTDDVLPANP